MLLFGTNGIVASRITFSSDDCHDQADARSGSLFLVSLFVFSKQQLHCWRNKRHFLYLVVSGLAMGLNWMFLYEAYTQIGAQSAISARLPGCDRHAALPHRLPW